jgi:hypothetical protein
MYDAPPLDEELVVRAELTLGVRLPRAYLQALEERNGGVLARQSYPVDFASSRGDGTIGVQALLGVGGRWGVDVMSRYLVEAWGYPPGIVVCMLPSAGHDTVMLDYAHCGPHGEPVVVYVDDDRVPRRIARDFEDFLGGLV